MNSNIRHQFFYSHSVETVWEYLTNAELLSQWLMNNDFQPVVGHEFQFRTKPHPDMNFDGTFYCKVLEIIPFKKLSYSWKGGDEKISLDSIVVWTLIEKDNGTELHLEHSGFKDENFGLYTGMNGGWLQNMQKIAKLLTAPKHDAASH